MRYLQLKAAHEEELRDVKLNNELGRDFKDSVEQIAKKGNFLTVTGEIDTTKYETIQFCNVQPKPIHELVFNDVPRLTGIAEETESRNLSSCRGFNVDFNRPQFGKPTGVLHKTSRATVL